MVAHIQRLPNYVKAFGPVHGMRLFLVNEKNWPSRSERIRRIHVPGYPSPLHLRDTVSDHAIFWQCMVLRQYDITPFPHHWAALKERYTDLLARNETPLILDCGGNIGLSAVWFARQFPEAHLVVLEPDRANLAVLRRNVAPFAERVTIVEGGIWSRKAKLRVVNPEAGSAAFRLEECGDDGEGAVQGYGVADILASAGADTLFIAKMDIEGAQRYVFQKNTDWLARSDLVILELDDWLFPWQGTGTAFFRAISAYDFDYLTAGENIFCFRHNSNY